MILSALNKKTKEQNAYNSRTGYPCKTLIVIIVLFFLTISCNQTNDTIVASKKAIQVQVLSTPKCKTTIKTISLVENTAKDLGININLELVEIKTIEKAEKLKFYGSPTVLVEGVDIDPPRPELARFGLT